MEELLTKLEEQSFEMLILTEKVAEYEEQLNTMVQYLRNRKGADVVRRFPIVSDKRT